MKLVTSLGVLLFAAFGPSWGYEWETRTFEAKLDHFSFTNNSTFKLRYLINDKWWDPTLTTSPIFFYTGNEGDITLFANNTGLVWELAPQFNALVVFAEHRYYGESMPFGNLSFSEPRYSGYLSSLQALADYIDLIYHLKTTYAKRDDAPIPVIAFGGSYGGMLAAWIRMKYPGVISGSLAASAPIWQFTGMADCTAFNKVTTRAYKVSGGEDCVHVIKRSWAAFDQKGSTEKGLTWLSRTFKTCAPLQSSENLKNWLSSTLVNLAMANYPYPSSFLGELPGEPVKAVCQLISTNSTDVEPLLKAVSKGVNLIMNYTGTVNCLDVSQADPTDLGDQGWNYQSCTEMVMPICDRGDTMFEEANWDIEAVSDNCYQQFKVRPDVNYARNLYGGKDIASASNIIFSNGFLDPWSSGGVIDRKNANENSLVTGPMEGAAHHLDLRQSDPLDPPSVRAARSQYVTIMKRWVQEIL